MDRQLTSFSANLRTPVTPSFRFSLVIFVSRGISRSRFFGPVEVLIWPDVAPKACQVLRQYVESDYQFQLSVTFALPLNLTDRQVQEGESVDDAIKHPLTEAMREIEETSALWSSPGSVCFTCTDEVPRLTVLDRSLTILDGQQPDNVFGEVSGFGVVVGKVVCGPVGKVVCGPVDVLRDLAAFDRQGQGEFGRGRDELSLGDGFFVFPTAFDCALLNE